MQSKFAPAEGRSSDGFMIPTTPYPPECMWTCRTSTVPRGMWGMWGMLPGQIGTIVGILAGSYYLDPTGILLVSRIVPQRRSDAVRPPLHLGPGSPQPSLPTRAALTSVSTTKRTLGTRLRVVGHTA
jgi:hypothetical protein